MTNVSVKSTDVTAKSVTVKIGSKVIPVHKATITLEAGKYNKIVMETLVDDIDLQALEEKTEVITYYDEISILTQAFKQALENGWRPHWPTDCNFTWWYVDRNSNGQLVITVVDNKLELKAIKWKDFMWDLDFHKALWGTACDCGNPNPENNPLGCSPEYEYQMKQMIVLPNVFPYLHEQLKKLDNK